MKKLDVIIKVEAPKYIEGRWIACTTTNTDGEMKISFIYIDNNRVYIN